MKALKFLVYSNIWISLGAGFLTLLTFKVFSINCDFNQHLYYSLFVFFCTLLSYNFQRVSRLKKIATHSPNAWVVKNSIVAKSLIGISLIGVITLVPIFDYPFTLLWLIILGVISFGYSYGKFRDLPYIKILLIALSWGIACGIIPLLIIGDKSNGSMFSSFGWVFFYIVAITIPFDIRDIGIDEDSKKTIPQWIGLKKSKFIAYFSLVISMFFFIIYASLTATLAIVLSYLVASYLIKKSFPSRKDMYFSFLVDGHIIFQFLLVYFLC